MTKLAILICTLPERERSFNRLIEVLQHQRKRLRNPQDVHIVYNDVAKGIETTGKKRNDLVQRAIEIEAKYIAHHDDDDLPGVNYLKRQLEGIELNVDCCSLIGQIYWSGKPGKPFYHSIENKEWWEDNQKYYRMPNHLNCQKLELVKDIPFPDQVFGEDGKQSYAMRDAGIFKTEHKIEEVIYHYYCGTKGTTSEQTQYNLLMKS